MNIWYDVGIFKAKNSYAEIARNVWSWVSALIKEMQLITTAAQSMP